MNSKEAILLEIEESRNYLLAYINTRFDALRAGVESGGAVTNDLHLAIANFNLSLPVICSSDASVSGIGLSGMGLPINETIYPLNANPALFKNTKPTAILDRKVMISV